MLAQKDQNDSKSLLLNETVEDSEGLNALVHKPL